MSINIGLYMSLYVCKGMHDAYSTRSDDSLIHKHGVDQTIIFRSFGVGDAGLTVHQANSILMV